MSLMVHSFKQNNYNRSSVLSDVCFWLAGVISPFLQWNNSKNNKRSVSFLPVILKQSPNNYMICWKDEYVINTFGFLYTE